MYITCKAQTEVTVYPHSDTNVHVKVPGKCACKHTICMHTVKGDAGENKKKEIYGKKQSNDKCL